MKLLLRAAGAIDRLNEWVGRLLMWLVLAAALVSAGNAVVRKLLNTSSNAWLEIQWYLFAAVFLLAAGYTLLRQEHVKIDVVLGRFARRTQVWVECFGIVVFLLPFVVVVIELVMPLVTQAWQSGERSSNAGGLIRWPVYALVPLGFALLGLQGLSELVKRIAFLAGHGPDPGARKATRSAEEELAEQIRAERGAGAAP
jgi:TRAP-type mannitol/chloroaromatic compound transport system permease small subunit